MKAKRQTTTKAIRIPNELLPKIEKKAKKLKRSTHGHIIETLKETHSK